MVSNCSHTPAGPYPLPWSSRLAEKPVIWSTELLIFPVKNSKGRYVHLSGVNYPNTVIQYSVLCHDGNRYPECHVAELACYSTGRTVL